MIKSYPFFYAVISRSRLMLVVARTTNALVVALLALVFFYSQVHWSVIVAVSILAGCGLEYCVHITSPTIEKISFNEQGTVVFRDKTDCNRGIISERSLVCDWWCLLHIKHQQAQPDLWLTLWRDAIDDQAYRRLSRVVRIKRRLI